MFQRTAPNLNKSLSSPRLSAMDALKRVIASVTALNPGRLVADRWRYVTLSSTNFYG